MSTTTTTLVQRPIFICSACWKPISGDGGYLAVDLTAVHTITGDGARINWRVRHAHHDEAAASTDFRLWVRNFNSMTDLVEKLCELADRKPWFAVTNWTGLLRRVLKDSASYPAIKAEQVTNGRVRKGELRHGCYGYAEGCRCEVCTTAHREQARASMARRRARQAGS